jgi:hypothetical protein
LVASIFGYRRHGKDRENAKTLQGKCGRFIATLAGRVVATLRQAWIGYVGAFFDADAI